MLVNEAHRRIIYKVGTIDDVTGKSVNQSVNNRTIIDELNTQLMQYANITKAITDVYSFPLNTNTPFVKAPPLALRSQAYWYCVVINNGTLFPADMRGAADVYPMYRYNPVQGITNWLMPWGMGKQQYLSTYPMNNVSAITTTLTSSITATDTTIPVAATGAVVNNHGRITIGSEKVLYAYKDSTNFYGCERGVEATTASAHENNSLVQENNVFLHYSRLPVKIVVNSDDTIPKDILSHEIEVADEHMDGIIKAVAYNVLLKIDPERGLVYKVDADELYKQYAIDVRKGYYRGRQGTGVRQPNPSNESGLPYGANLAGY